jgi:curli biogenesis system outer membrane secretion channel CsgG
LETQRVNMNRLAIVLAGGIALAGCGSNQPSEDPNYEGSDVSGPAIQPVSAPFAGSFIAIVPFVNKTLAQHRELGSVAPDIISAYAIDAGFRVAEGQKGQLNNVMDEMNFQQTEFVDPNTAVKVGKMYGARFVLVGAVTDYRVTKARGSKGVDVLGLVDVGGSDQSLVYDVQVSSRIVDVQTREVICADSGTAVKEKYAVTGGHVNVLGVGTHDSQQVETQDESMGKVLKIAFAKSMNKLVAQANRRAPAYMQAAPPPAYAPPAAPPQPAPPPPPAGQ